MFYSTENNNAKKKIKSKDFLTKITKFIKKNAQLQKKILKNTSQNVPSSSNAIATILTP